MSKERKRQSSTKPRKQVAANTPANKLGLPDTSVLARYSPTKLAQSHPDWIKQKFGTYIDPHAGHERTSVRQFTHAGHVVKITTTYRVEVDGQEVHTHLSVDEDGRVFTHALPFETYSSAVDLMKNVIDAYADDFTGSGHPHDDHHTHGDHS